MKYYEYSIDYDPKNGTLGVVAIDTDKELNEIDVVNYLFHNDEIETRSPNDFDFWEITKEEFEKENDGEYTQPKCKLEDCKQGLKWDM